MWLYIHTCAYVCERAYGWVCGCLDVCVPHQMYVIGCLCVCRHGYMYASVYVCMQGQFLGEHTWYLLWTHIGVKRGKCGLAEEGREGGKGENLLNEPRVSPELNLACSVRAKCELSESEVSWLTGSSVTSQLGCSVN